MPLTKYWVKDALGTVEFFFWNKEETGHFKYQVILGNVERTGIQAFFSGNNL